MYSPTSSSPATCTGRCSGFVLQDLNADAKYRRFMPSATLNRTLAGLQRLPNRRCSFPIIAEGLADIVRAGGHGALGEHGEQPGIGTHGSLGYAER